MHKDMLCCKLVDSEGVLEEINLAWLDSTLTGLFDPTNGLFIKYTVKYLKYLDTYPSIKARPTKIAFH